MVAKAWPESVTAKAVIDDEIESGSEAAGIDTQTNGRFCVNSGISVGVH